jgi:tetratricopeptide (TPR) repeat protein
MGNRNILLSLLVLLLFSCNSQKQLVNNCVDKKSLDPVIQRQFDYYFYEALRLKEEKQLDAAMETFLLCRSIDSLDAAPWSELGKLYLSISKTQQAVECFERAVKLQPSNWWYNEQLISLYSNLNNWKRAIAIAEALRVIYPEKESIYSVLGVLYKENKEYEKAIVAYDKLEKLTSVDEYISLEKFRLYVLCNKSKKAIAEIDKLIVKYPEISRYKVLRGDIFMQQNMPQKAFSIYQKVEQDDPQNAYVYVSLSEYYTAINEHKKALESIVKALKNDQLEVDTKMDVLGQYVEKLVKDSTKFKDTESLFTLLVDRYPLEEKVHGYYALFLLYQHRNAAAVAELESMLNINSKIEQTWIRLIQLYLSENNYKELSLVTTRANSQLPQQPIFYFYKGISMAQLGDYKSAIFSFQAALPLLKPDQNGLKADLYAQMGDVFYKLEDRKSSFDSYEQSLLANPKSVMVMNNYAYYLSLEKSELKKAEKMSAKTVELEPKNSTFLDTYAWILYQQGSYSLAKFYIERAIDNLGTKEDASVVYDHYGDILWMISKGTGEFDAKALEMWTKSLNAGNKSESLKMKILKKGWVR